MTIRLLAILISSVIFLYVLDLVRRRTLSRETPSWRSPDGTRPSSDA